jgi:hypothetical protein
MHLRNSKKEKPNPRRGKMGRAFPAETPPEEAGGSVRLYRRLTICQSWHWREPSTE